MAERYTQGEGYNADLVYEDGKLWIEAGSAEKAAMIAAAMNAQAQPRPLELKAWARRWFIDGEQPYKIKNERTGRMITAAKFHMKEITPNKLFHNDVPLYLDHNAIIPQENKA